MTNFVVTVEHETTGIRGVHYVWAHWPSDAAKKAEGPGLIIVGVEVWGRNTQFPNLPNYIR